MINKHKTFWKNLLPLFNGLLLVVGFPLCCLLSIDILSPSFTFGQLLGGFVVTLLALLSANFVYQAAAIISVSRSVRKKRTDYDYPAFWLVTTLSIVCVAYSPQLIRLFFATLDSI